VTDSPSPAQVVGDLAKAHIAARCLHVAATFGVADAIGDRPTDPREIGARTGLDPDAVGRILRLLAAHGVFESSAEGYSHNAASRLLRSDHPESLRSYVRMTGMPAFWGRFTELAGAAQAGRPSVDWRGLLAYFEQHPDEAQIFNAAMVAKSRSVLPAVIGAYDFSRYGVVADIGGGRGHLLAAILEHAPTVRGILFELPHVAADAMTSESARLEIVAGDFFTTALPMADLYLLMDLLHDWRDDDAARILSAVRRAAPAHARLLIIETLVPETPGPHFGKTLDLIMLAVTGGRERTRAQYAALLERAGLRLERVLPTRSEYSIVEASAA
jgi:SAM-dependent methyltransferase